MYGYPIELVSLVAAVAILILAVSLVWISVRVRERSRSQKPLDGRLSRESLPHAATDDLPADIAALEPENIPRDLSQREPKAEEYLFRGALFRWSNPERCRRRTCGRAWSSLPNRSLLRAKSA